ncbi:chorismate synthase [Candidatus Gracilibacteria bacterium]|nr:chorismate synthase [Candidatus Gracilibacteria bacterium]
MAGNSIGTVFKVTTWGESHGPALGVVIDGCPAGIEIGIEDIQREVDARKPQAESGGTARKEEDIVEILSGIFEGKTTGMPISMMVKNKDHKSEDYGDLKDVYRPGHADYAYDLKYGFRDHRGGGRASGRETVSRVIAGAIAKKILVSFAPTCVIIGHTVQIGEIEASRTNLVTLNSKTIASSPLRCIDSEATEKILTLIEKTRNEGDSLGGIIEIRIQNPPQGLGEPVFDKLNADLAKAIFSIPAIRGVSFGEGFRAATMRGSEHNDNYEMRNGNVVTETNHAGGILGGISTGEEIVIQIAIKPPSSIGKKQETIGIDEKQTTIEIKGRHDTCIVPRIIPVAESMTAITLVDHLLRQRAGQHILT